MRKLFAIAAMSVFLLTISSAYACGEKKSSAKTSKASYGLESGSEATKASATESNAEKAEVKTANTVDVKTYCGKKGDVSKTSVMKTDASNGCHWKGEAKASVMKTDARIAKADCPATKDFPAPCNKDSRVENMKAEKDDLMSDDSEASISTVTSSSK
jgi:hypothetical protein